MAVEPKRASLHPTETSEFGALLDASALLALLQNEPGADEVVQALPTGAISAANLSETVAKLVQKGVPEKRATSAVLSFDLDVLVVNETVALAAGELAKQGKQLGLSLGDRICLATGKLAGIPILTTDQRWLELPKSYRVNAIR